jgi:HSP20 family protein
MQLPRRGRPARRAPRQCRGDRRARHLDDPANAPPLYGESEQVIVAERPQGSFTRRLSLGEGVDSENLTAGYADGVLHLTIPASPKAQARRVEITRASGGRRTISGSTVEQGEAPAGGTGSAVG